MRFTKLDTINLLKTYGRAYFNPTLTGKSKDHFLKIIQSNYPSCTTEDLEKKLDQLHKKYISCNETGNKKWEYYDAIDTAVKLAYIDYLPTKDLQNTGCFDDDDDDDICDLKSELTMKEKVSKKRHIEDNKEKFAKKMKIETNHVKQSIRREEKSTCSGCDKSNQQTTNDLKGYFDNLKQFIKVENDRCINQMDKVFKALADDLKQDKKNNSTDLTLIHLEKEKQKRIGEMYIMSKTLLDEQRQTNESLCEAQTNLKSTSGAYKTVYDTVMRNNEMLNQICNAIQNDNTQNQSSSSEQIAKGL